MKIILALACVSILNLHATDAHLDEKSTGVADVTAAVTPSPKKPWYKRALNCFGRCVKISDLAVDAAVDIAKVTGDKKVISILETINEEVDAASDITTEVYLELESATDTGDHIKILREGVANAIEAGNRIAREKGGNVKAVRVVAVIEKALRDTPAVDERTTELKKANAVSGATNVEVDGSALDGEYHITVNHPGVGDVEDDDRHSASSLKVVTGHSDETSA